MNRVQPEHVHSTIFTPQEYQVELIDSCLQQNTIAVLASKSTRSFLITMVTRELSYQTRSDKDGGLGKRTLIIGKFGPKLVRAGEAIQQNTNLAVATYTALEQVEGWQPAKWRKVVTDSQIIVITVDVLETAMETESIPFDLLNLFIITDANQIISSHLLHKVLLSLGPSCRILGLTSPVLSRSLAPPQLDCLLRYLKDTTSCQIDTSSEIVTILRYIHKPRETFIMCASPFLAPRPDPETEVRRLAAHAMTFLNDHRYDLVEVYGPEYAEFCVGVPDPVKEPKQILTEFVSILDNLGLWCADRAALYALVEIEKLKKKTAYDRHYLLLCLVFSLIARIRAVIEESFENHSELNQILNFSTPKVLRLVDILRLVRPLNFVDPRKRREKIENKESSDNDNSNNLINEDGDSIENVDASKDNTVSVSKHKSVTDISSDNCESAADEPKRTLLNCCICSCHSPLERMSDKKSSDIDRSSAKDAEQPNSSCSKYDINGLGDDIVTGCEINVNETTLNNLLDTVHCAKTPVISETELSKNIATVENEVCANATPITISECSAIENAVLNNDDESLSGRCDSVQNKETDSTSLLNGSVSSSEDSFYESEIKDLTDLASVPAVENPHSPGIDRSCSRLSELSFSSCHEMISCNSSLSVMETATNCCPCHCHSNYKNQSVPQEKSLKPLLNGCVLEQKPELDNGTNSDINEYNNSQSSKDGLEPEHVISSNLETFPESDDLTRIRNQQSDDATKSQEQTENTVGDVNLDEGTSLSETLTQLLPGGYSKFRRKRDEVKEKVKVHNPEDPDSVCALIFVQNRTMAKIIYRLLKELSDIGGDFGWIFPQYTVELCKNAVEDPRAADAEHKKQEEVLRRFRHHECNILVSTEVLESGIDIPHCNLVIRFDPASSYLSYVHSRGRAKGQCTFYIHMVVKEEEEQVLNDMASYMCYESVLLRQCGSVDKGTDSEVTPDEADTYCPPYVTPADSSVTMSSAISLLNRYCAKLPSDTFTRLTPMWSIETSVGEDGDGKFQCTVMLPINSPLKGYTKGLWMVKNSLAKMSAALESCKCLHEIGELDNNLMPVGKESMQLDDHLCAPLPDDQVVEGMPRPGTTKRRQYYYKKVAECFIGREPSLKVNLWVYKLDMVLTCPIPDEQNTRGRKIYRPELSSRSLGLVTTKPIPEISGFPVFTRSGEVMVKVKNVCKEIMIEEAQIEGLAYFHYFTFTHVLRLEKYPIKFRPSNAKCTYYIAPLVTENDKDDIDWEFVKLIQAKGDPKPTPPSEEQRAAFSFDQFLYADAVVMPWYRNQDQPQYFYVAEICSHLNPQSDFPDAGFETFEKYYLTKYGIQISNLKQPLLDVDHTSGRLNLLTPRHVNRKGVALPTTSEETKRAKRENLQQKQILVPELCTIHPFPASLWRKAVCLPTILYRINGLLLANELRVNVADEIGLGLDKMKFDFDWPPLDFGWSLADVLSKTSEANKELEEKAKADEVTAANESSNKLCKKESKKSFEETNEGSESKNGVSELEIGTWSNDMAVYPEISMKDSEIDYDIDTFDPDVDLPDNLTLLDGTSIVGDDTEGELGADWGTGIPERKAKKRKNGSGEVVRVGSPSNFEEDGWDTFGGRCSMFSPYGSTNYNGLNEYDDYYEYGDDFDGYESEQDEENKKEELDWEEQNKRSASDKESLSDEENDQSWPEESIECSSEKMEKFKELLEKKKSEILNGTGYVAENEPIIIEKPSRKQPIDESDSVVIAKAEDSPAAECAEDKIKTLTNSVNLQPLANSQAFPELSFKINREGTLEEVRVAANYISLPENPPDSFSFDYQPELESHPGPSPSIILQALTMSNANDGVNLERLETIGDSYLKYAITNYLYCTYTQKHEGKLSYLRSKQVSNLNLYRLGKRKRLGECMVATKFEPHDNWLPPGYFVPRELEEALIDSGVPAGHWNMADFPGLHDLASEEIRRLVHERSEQIKLSNAEQLANQLISVPNPQDLPIFIPYNLLTQHSIPDKSIADCVEALIGSYLTMCGPKGALLFMSWLGIKVLPSTVTKTDDTSVIIYHQLRPPKSPLDSCPLPAAEEQLKLLLSGYSEFEEKIGYYFRDRSYLMQAFTHASYYRNRLTDCYQRLEFLGDAVLDYLITRHLFEDKRQHSPGALTDLRSALVNNTIFASLAVKYEFHKYFRHFSPGLDRVVRDFVRMQEENGHKVNEEYYFMEEDECEAAEDIEVPKALGDVFESVAGAIFLDSGGSLDAVWKVYYNMMKNEIEQFSGVVPKSPIRELLEMEPETAKFGKPERLVDGKVRVSVEIFGKGSFSGVGRNYRIAKSTAAKRALRHLKKIQMMPLNESSSTFP